MKTLLILRHAKSSWKFPDRSDHDRPRRAVPRDDDRRGGAGNRQPREAPGRRTNRKDRGAGHHRDDPDALGVRRPDPAAVSG